LRRRIWASTKPAWRDTWIAPPLWRSEFRNILAGHLRGGSLDFDEICSLQQEAERLLADSERQVDSSTVLQLVRESECSAYDCEFVALALQLGTLLVTMDGKLCGRSRGSPCHWRRRPERAKSDVLRHHSAPKGDKLRHFLPTA
jgi:predicted nucleic acid-binding protein